jgi:hypothetical protein
VKKFASSLLYSRIQSAAILHNIHHLQCTLFVFRILIVDTFPSRKSFPNVLHEGVDELETSVCESCIEILNLREIRHVCASVVRWLAVFLLLSGSQKD